MSAYNKMSGADQEVSYFIFTNNNLKLQTFVAVNVGTLSEADDLLRVILKTDVNWTTLYS